jgi:hypothetical protein
MGVETTNRSQKIRLAAAKTRKKNSNSVFFAKVLKIMDYYSQKTEDYPKGYDDVFVKVTGNRFLRPVGKRLRHSHDSAPRKNYKLTSVP